MIRILFITLILSNIINAKVLSTPYEINSSTETIITTAATVMGLSYNLTGSNLEPLSVYEIDNLMNKKLLGINRISVNNYNDDVAMISDILLGICIATPALQVFDGRVSPEWTTYGMMFLESTAITVGATTVTKNIIRDPRPYIYSADAPLEMKQQPDARLSFFSGHAALSFASMTFFAETYSKYYPDNSNHNLIWLGSMTLAGTTAILRVFSGRHFPLDILVGSAVGFAVGKMIPVLHEKSSDQMFIVSNRTQKIFSINFNL
jgi:hypothetical protein